MDEDMYERTMEYMNGLPERELFEQIRTDDFFKWEAELDESG